MVEQVFHADAQIQAGHFRAEIIGGAHAPQHIAGNAAGAAVGAFRHGVGVVGELAGLEFAVKVKRPVARRVVQPQRAFMLRRERHLIALVAAVFADGGVDVGIAGVGGQVVQFRRQLRQVVTQAAFQPGVAGFAARGHAVGHLIGVVLVVEVDQEQPDFAGQRIAGVAGAQLPGARFLGFNLAAIDRFAHLAVLYGAEGAFGVGVQVPVFVQVIHHVQRRQRRVIANVEAVVLDVVVLIRLDVLVAHARRDGPVADVDAIVDIEGVRLGAGLGIAIVRAGGGRQPAGAGLAGVAQLVGGFADVAVADANLMG